MIKYLLGIYLFMRDLINLEERKSCSVKCSFACSLFSSSAIFCLLLSVSLLPVINHILLHCVFSVSAFML